ncbi:hypothetical protein ACLMJK_009312 [Lecanora helva]
MLLPSALDCAPGIQPMRSVYSASRDMLSPQRRTTGSHSSTAPAFNACIALQSLLTSNISAPPTTTQVSNAPLALASPIDFTAEKATHKQKPKKLIQRLQDNYERTKTPLLPLQPSKKRRRSSSTSDDSSPTHNPAPSTPKRQRLYPPTLPLGLNHTDFDALQQQEEAAAIPLPSTPLTHPPHSHQSFIHNTTTTTNNTAAEETEDSALIATILHKLRLKQGDWDRVQVQGDGNGSIGERFKFLLDERSGLAFRRRGGWRGRRRVREVGFGGMVGDGGEEGGG